MTIGVKGKPNTLSPSELVSYQKCGVQYRYTYIQGRKEPPAFAMIMGTGLHSGVEEHMKAKIRTGEDAPVDLAIEAAMTAFRKESDARINKVRDFGWDPDAEGEDGKGNEIEQKLIQGVRTFHSGAAPLIRPLSTEEWIRVSLEGTGVTMTGRKDLVVMHKPDFYGSEIGEGVDILDIKFQKNKPSPESVMSSPQLTAYAVAQRFADGEYPKRVGLVAITKTKVPEVVTAFATPTVEHERSLMIQMGLAIDGIKKGVFMPPPPPPFSWHCTAKSCGFWKECKARLGPRTIVGGGQ